MREYVFSDKISQVTPSAIREILKFTADPSVISFAAGNPSPESFPVQFIAGVTADILRESPTAALQYSISEGYPPLREALRRLAAERYGLDMENNDLIVVSGAQQGLEFACKVFCNEGDVLLCEEPAFVGALNAFRSYNVELVGVPMESDGVDLAALRAVLLTHKNVKLFYTIPNFQNPSGSTMSHEKRRAAYDLCRDFGVLILEDNPYGDLRFSGSDIPAIKADDPEGQVIYCGSFSKILSPGLRVGFYVAPPAVIAKTTVAKQVTDVHTNILAQMICHRFLTAFDFPAHIENIRALYRRKCSLMLGEMERAFHPAVSCVKPEGGIFIWCTLPRGIDMQRFVRRAVERGVAVVPGNAFMVDESAPCQSFRLNYSTPSESQIREGMAILGALTHEMMGEAGA